jgi:hypothetical protein
MSQVFCFTNRENTTFASVKSKFVLVAPVGNGVKIHLDQMQGHIGFEDVLCIISEEESGSVDSLNGEIINDDIKKERG